MDSELMISAYRSLIEDEHYEISLLANTSALINQFLENINWAGFYLYLDEKLVLGPFQGKTACQIITLDRGVCGKAARERRTVVVADVHQFAGHIACDSASQSEIVVPIILEGNLYGVLDIDAPIKNRFSDQDRKNLEEIVMILQEKLLSLKSVQ